MSKEKEIIAKYQSQLLELLDSELDLEELKNVLSKNDEFEELRDYLNAIEINMLEVARELLKKWGSKN